MQQRFTAPWWAKSPHVQTILPVLTKVAKPCLQRQRLELADGDFLDLDWQHPPTEQQPIVILIHGLEGNADSHYILRMLQACAQNELAAVVHHHRSCSGEPNRLARSYHSGDTQDLSFTLQTLKQQYPNNPIFAVGYSLGGNVLAKYLGESKQACLVDRAVVISAPLELAACAKKLEKGFSRVYQRHLIKQLQQKVLDKIADPSIGHFMPIKQHQVKGLISFFQFDHQVTAPLHGFSGVEDYYLRSSGLPYLREITKPTLIIHAQDDPFMTHAVIPKREFLPEQVEYELHKQGGHVGFIEGGSLFNPRYYLERRVMDFLNGGENAYSL